MTYPTELIEKAEYEISVFERVARDTGLELIEEVKRLRVEIKHDELKCAPVERDVRL